MSIKPALEVVKAWLILYRHLPWEKTLLYTTAAGAKIDLTGASIKAVVKKDADDPDEEALFTFSTDDGTIVPGKGFLTLKVPLASTVDEQEWEEGVAHIVAKIGSDTPFVIAFLGFMIRNSTTDSP